MHGSQPSKNETASPKGLPQVLKWVSAASLGARPPPRTWLVPELIPGRNVTLLSGDGGTGKSLLALQLAVAVATRDSLWLGLEVAHGGAVFVSAEDELDEVHRRLANICAADGPDITHLTDLTVLPLAGRDAVLGRPGAPGELQSTPMFEFVRSMVGAMAPALVIVDTISDAFGGNENSRSEVRQFVGMLRALAMDADCAILLLAHPSVAGLNSGTGLSGSTAWNNSV
jgi:RecA-family ATPase